MKKHDHQLLLGAHMSIAGGFEKAIERGESIGCSAIQIFTKSNRQWNAKPITPEEAETFKDALKNSSIRTVITHAMYLINLGSPDPKTRSSSAHALAIELERCNLLEIPYLVLHPGSRLNGSVEDGLKHVADSINSVLQKNPGTTSILLENMAGQGSSLCSRFEELATIYHLIENKQRMGVCFDTCHAFAAGYDMRTPETYSALWKEFDETVGLKELKAIHLNDSKKELGSHVDRHEDIGKGQLGLEAFRLIMNDSRFFDTPKILETPETEIADYARNMQTLIELVSNDTKKILGI